MRFPKILQIIICLVYLEYLYHVILKLWKLFVLNPLIDIGYTELTSCRGTTAMSLRHHWHDTSVIVLLVMAYPSVSSWEELWPLWLFVEDTWVPQFDLISDLTVTLYMPYPLSGLLQALGTLWCVYLYLFYLISVWNILTPRCFSRIF